MREKPGFGTVDLQTRHFSELNVLWLRRPSQTAVANMCRIVYLLAGEVKYFWSILLPTLGLSF